MFGRLGRGQSPGTLILIGIMVLIALIMFSGDSSPEGLLRAGRNLAFLLPMLILSLTLHEFAHAWMAFVLGDNTARAQGRLTLDPRAHLDPLGTFMLVITVLLGFGIGWAKPVPVNPWRLSIGARPGMAVVALAGPVTNLIIAFVVVQLVKGLDGTGLPRDVLQLVFVLARLNIALAVFNMIPLPPLDGYRVLVGILPNPAANSLASIEPYGPMILLLVVFMGQGLITGIIRAVELPLLRVMGA